MREFCTEPKGKKKKVNIAYFLDISRGIGGAGNLLIQQAKLMSAYHKILMVVPCDTDGIPNPEYEKRCRKLGIRTEALDFPTSYNFYNVDLLRSLECTEKIREMAVRYKIDFFHTVQLNVAVELVARELGVPHLMNIYQLKEAEFKLCQGDIFAQYHLCDSKLYSELWRRCLHIESRCIRPVAPVDQVVKKGKYGQKKLRFIMLGAVCDRKNQLTAIKAVERCLSKYEIELIIAGDYEGLYGGECRKYVEERKLKQNIRMVGFISDIKGLLSDCDCFLCASRDESFPSSIVEAVTYDLTIVSTPVAGVPELFYDKVNCLLSEGYEVCDIEKVLVRTFQVYKDGKIADIHENARKLWEGHFSPKKVREQLEEYYQQIAGQKWRLNRCIDIQNMVLECRMTEQQLHQTIARGIDKRRILYYSFLKLKMQGKKICIWGAGKLGRQAYELIHVLYDGVIVEAYIDSNRDGVYMGLPIVKPEEVDNLCVDVVVIGFYRNQDAAVKFLVEKGWKCNENVWILP